MYRHFAVVTVLLTGALALFAEGENTKAAASETGQVTQASARPQGNEPRLVLKNDPQGNPAALSGFYHDTGQLRSANDGLGGFIPGESRRARRQTVDFGRLAQMGITPEVFAAMSPEDQAQLIAMLNGGVSSAERARMIREATLASARRSGQDEGQEPGEGDF